MKKDHKIITLVLLFTLLPTGGVFAAKPEGLEQRINRLRSFIKKDKNDFIKRKRKKTSILETLDAINSDQNNIRHRIESNEMNAVELSMALDNLKIEHRQLETEQNLERHRLLQLIKVAHKVKRDGIIRFILNGDNLTNLVGRVRILFRTLRSHSVIAMRLEEKSKRLMGSEESILSAQKEIRIVGEQLDNQSESLSGMLETKKRILRKISKKQNYYLAAYKEVKQRERKLKRLFKKFDSQKQNPIGSKFSKTLGSPLAKGKVLKKFGKRVHRKFKTVTFQKGLEILSDHNSPVLAVSDGVVEYDGWVKGLGNVIIVHHGTGLYSLSGHLYMSMQGVGSEVKRGDTIGLVGDTGNSNRPSLYFELRENDQAVNPLKYIDMNQMKDLT